jgi:hypothetical protein
VVIPPGSLAAKPRITTLSAGTSHWVPQVNERYVVSAWFQGPNGSTPDIVLQLNGGTTLAPVSKYVSEAPIDGWRKVDVEFLMPGNYTDLSIYFTVPTSAVNCSVDDIRIHPADGSMTTYVYDKGLYWLKAQLDDRNYATFYNYDEEGVLVQVKQETERGVMTLRTTRQNSVTATPLPPIQ